MDKSGSVWQGHGVEGMSPETKRKKHAMKTPMILTPETAAQPTTDRSQQYWRKFTRDLMARRPDICRVEVVRSGRKTDSEVLKCRQHVPPPGMAVIVASTGGKWGRSRRDFLPAV